LRAELLGRVVAAQFDLERAIANLIRSGASTAFAQNELGALGKLQRQIGSANPVTLATLSGTVAAAIASAQDVNRQAATLAIGNDPDAANTLIAVAGAKARAAVQEDMRDIYDRKVLDPYLRFASTADEEAYRRHEEETRRAIEKALAERTPEGDLRAAKLLRDQLLDAKEHGADASPDFANLVARNEQGIAGLESAMANAQPARSQPATAPTSAVPADTTPPASDDKLASVMAQLRSVGVAGGISADQSGHGLSASANAPAVPRGVG
jgi:hypothetical protein